MNQHQYSGEEFAERFGRVCLEAFRGETWEECRSSVKKSWDALAVIHKSWKAQAITWEEALPLIHKAWSPAKQFGHN